MVNGVPREVQRPTPRGRRPRVFLAAGLSKGLHSPGYPKAFQHMFILLSSQTSKEGFLSANGLPREYHGPCL